MTPTPPDLALDPDAFAALLEARWSPQVYARTPVPPEALRRVVSAAVRAPSSGNEQPWRFVVGVEGAGDTRERVLGVLNERNRGWAHRAPVLGLAFAATKRGNGGDYRHNLYDTGAAVMAMALAATAEGLALHPMAGFDQEAARAAFGVPDGFEAVVAFALGTPGDPDDAPDVPPDQAARDHGRRPRRPLAETAFGDAWGTPLFEA